MTVYDLILRRMRKHPTTVHELLVATKARAIKQRGFYRAKSDWDPDVISRTGVCIAVSATLWEPGWVADVRSLADEVAEVIRRWGVEHGFPARGYYWPCLSDYDLHRHAMLDDLIERTKP